MRGFDPSVFANWDCSRKGPDGRTLCRACGSTVPKPRRTICSTSCQDAISLMFGHAPTAERLVFARDRGVCCACHLDTEKQIDDAVIANIAPGWTRKPALILEARERAIAAILERLGIHHYRSRLWDIDHVKAVEEGGLNVLDNLQTLCLSCHAAKTAQHAKRRAITRRKRAKEGPKARAMREAREAALGK